MELSDIQQALRDQIGLEIGPAMSAYVLKMLEPRDTDQASAVDSIPVIGADARTGVAVRRFVPTDLFTAVQP